MKHALSCLIERFPIDCRKTKTKGIILAIRPFWPFGKTRVVKTRLVLVWIPGIPIGWESGVSFVNQSQSVVVQNQSKREITFDTQLKTALYYMNRVLREERSQ